MTTTDTTLINQRVDDAATQVQQRGEYTAEAIEGAVATVRARRVQDYEDTRAPVTDVAQLETEIETELALVKLRARDDMTLRELRDVVRRLV